MTKPFLMTPREVLDFASPASPFYRQPELFFAYMWLANEANWEPASVRLPRQMVHLKIGEMALSEESFAGVLGITRKAVRCRLERLEKAGLISTKGTKQGTIVTITNYAVWHLLAKTQGPTKGPTLGPTKGPTLGPTRNPEYNSNQEEIEELADEPGPTLGPTKGPTLGPTLGTYQDTERQRESETRDFKRAGARDPYEPGADAPTPPAPTEVAPTRLKKIEGGASDPNSAVRVVALVIAVFTPSPRYRERDPKGTAFVPYEAIRGLAYEAAERFGPQVLRRFYEQMSERKWVGEVPWEESWFLGWCQRCEEDLTDPPLELLKPER